MGKPRGESRGLKFLTKVRPDAMGHLLKFFGESGKHLEPKTRFLISIVTKVINFSPRGLEQYVSRAMKEGATADEVIDAILCSYPCAGLTRVVDALDVILDMGLPGFDDAGSPEAVEPAAAQAPVAGSRRDARWVRVASLDELPPGGALHIAMGSHDIALFHVEGAIHAIDHACPHKHGPLAGGSVTGKVVTCPLHSWKFALETGECLNHPGARVRTYETRIEAGSVEVKLPA